MAAAATEFSLVLLGRFPGKDKAVAAALGRDFAHDDAWGMQVLSAAPIVVLAGLTAEQAQAIHAALADVEAAGSKIEVQPGLDPGLPKLSWPTPPRIRGRQPLEYLPSGGPPPAAATFILPCPYTGQRMRLTITLSLSRAEQVGAATGATPAVSATPAAMAPLPIPVPIPQAPRPPSAAAAAYRAIPTPVASPAVPLTRPGSSALPAPLRPLRRSTPPAGAPPPAPAEAPVIHGLDDLDELQPIGQAPLPTVNHAPPAPQQPRAPTRIVPPSRIKAPIPMSLPGPVTQPGRQSGAVPTRPVLSASAPLPDVPVLQSPMNPPPAPAAAEALGSQTQPPLPMDLMSAPMDLSAFEANVTASGILHATPVQQLGQAPAAPVANPAAAADDDGLWSVFMGKSANPRVHQVVAELQGISVAEAARLCQKPVVSLAKDVSGTVAREIRQRMVAVSAQVRLTKRG